VYDLIRDTSGKPIGFVLTAQPLSSIAAVSNKIMMVVLVTALAGLVLVLILLFVVVRPISRTVKHVAAAVRQIGQEDLPALARAVEALAQGDLTQTATVSAQRVEVRGRDELGSMATDVNGIPGRRSAR
jgi:methyl-accepting chemotaxis protein